MTDRARDVPRRPTQDGCRRSLDSRWEFEGAATALQGQFGRRFQPTTADTSGDGRTHREQSPYGGRQIPAARNGESHAEPVDSSACRRREGEA